MNEINDIYKYIFKSIKEDINNPIGVSSYKIEKLPTEEEINLHINIDK